MSKFKDFDVYPIAQTVPTKDQMDEKFGADCNHEGQRFICEPCVDAELARLRDSAVELAERAQKRDVKIELLKASLEEFGDICAGQADDIMKLKSALNKYSEDEMLCAKDTEIKRLNELASCGCGDGFTAGDPGICGNCTVQYRLEIDRLTADNARLTEELESHAWEISPAMAQAQIDALQVQLAEGSKQWAAVAKLKLAIRETLAENSHLADGEQCTLIKLKRAVEEVEP